MPEAFNAISFQGFAGAYSDMACRAVFPGLKTIPCPSFEEAFAALQDGRADLAMIPVDNNLAGRVADVHHLLPASGLYIIGEHFQPIEHALLGIKGAKTADIRHVHSHVHALPQCRKAIKRLGLTPHVHADTAGAAEEVSKMGDKAHGAIASKLAGEIYGLDVLENNMQDADHNTTRFIILSREPKVPELQPGVTMLTSLVFKVRNVPAALYKSLGGFASNGINLAKIESYVDERFQAAQFYCEAEAHPAEDRLRLALEELNFFAADCRLLGTYAAHPFRRAQV